MDVRKMVQAKSRSQRAAAGLPSGVPLRRSAASRTPRTGGALCGMRVDLADYPVAAATIAGGPIATSLLPRWVRRYGADDETIVLWDGTEITFGTINGGSRSP